MKAKFLALFLFAGLLAIMHASPAFAQGEPQRIEITAKRFGYTPNEITVKVGKPVLLVLKSLDVAHGLRVRDLGIDMKVKAGQTSQVEFTPSKVGDFVGHCSVFCGSGHGSMTFKLHVVS
ncbi:MAG: cupredoxin domain-containing protein [Terracidiphilus sp.]|jgi:cytochrome c oxidase subunit 2